MMTSMMPSGNFSYVFVYFTNIGFGFSLVFQFSSLKNNFDDMKEKLENFKNTFQGLIFGSAVNWAKDDALRDLVLELGTSVDELTKD